MRAIFILLAALLCGHAIAETHIDSSTEASFKGTFAQMMRELPPPKAAELSTAVAALPFAGMTSARDTPADEVVKLDLKKIDGMTADQIIELVRKTVTVKIRVGPPPGLPERFKAPLRAAGAQNGGVENVSSLVGTQWDLTDDINGFISHKHITLLAHGEVVDGESTRSHWEQIGDSVRIGFNDSYVVYIGAVNGLNSMQGEAANVNGSEWKWVARRSDSK